MIRSKKTSKDSAMVTHLHLHMNQQHFTVPMKPRVVAGPAGQLTRLSDIGVVLGSHTAGTVTLSKQDHERAMDAAFSVLRADDGINKAIIAPVISAVGRMAAGAVGRKVAANTAARGAASAAGAGAGAGAAGAGTAAGVGAAAAGAGAGAAGTSTFDKLKDANAKREEMAMLEQQKREQMSQSLRGSANPASTNTTQFA
mgnify:CR=1 FL=1